MPRQGMYRLSRDYRITARNHRIVIPIYFRFDGASVPSIGWKATYTPFDPHVITAAAVHDWLYVNHQTKREDADDIFHDLLLQAGAGSKRAWLMWEAVKIAGGPHWEYSHKDRSELHVLYHWIKHRHNFSEYHFPIYEIKGA